MEVNINIPSSLNEIPLKHYQEFLKVQKDSTDEEFIAQKMVELFCGIPLLEVAKIKLSSLNELIAHFTKLFDSKPEFQPTFKMKNIEFGFIPELQDITFGEYVDLESSLESWDNMHKAMAILYRPIKKKLGKKYDIIDYSPDRDMQELMRFAPLDVVIASNVFFWNLGKELLTATLSYLEKQVSKDKTIQTTLAKQLNLGSGGDGIKAYMQSLKETSQSLTKLHNYDLLNVSPISYSKSKKQTLKDANLNDK